MPMPRARVIVLVLGEQANAARLPLRSAPPDDLDLPSAAP
jgi:hypothetical protein